MCGNLGRQWSHVAGWLMIVLLACGVPGLARAQHEEVTPPRPLSDTTPSYPPAGEGSASVILELVVQRDGTVGEVVVVDGRAPFAEAAVDAARSWRFEPAQRDGTPVAARIRFRLDFEQVVVEKPEVAPDVPTVPQLEPSSEQPQGIAEAAEPAAPESPIEVDVRGTRLGTVRRVSRAEARQLPGSFGNPFRAVEMFPGVTPTLSGMPYFYVRGAPPGNVGYFVDDIRLPALFHVLAGPSVIHPGLIDAVDFYPGAFPARFGRFTGGIGAGQLRQPEQRLHGEANVRAFDSSALLQVPIRQGLSATVAGRYSYANPIARLFAPDISVLYWDYQSRLSQELGPRDRITLFVFGSRDDLLERREDGQVPLFVSEFHRLDLGYRRQLAAGSLRLRNLLGWDRSLQQEGKVELTNLSSSWRVDVEHQLDSTTRIEAGADLGHDRYHLSLEELDDPDEDERYRQRFPTRVESVAGAYTSLDWQATPRVVVTPGVRADLYRSLDTVELGVAPRVNAELEVSPRWSVLHGFGVAHQPPSSALPQPGNTPALGEGLQHALQSSAGVRFADPTEGSVQVTVFQSVLFNLTDGPGIARIGDAEDRIDEDTRATGSSRGLELLLKRSFAQRLSGFFSYTLASSRRSVGRAEAPALFDRRHVLSGAVSYRFDGGYQLGARGSFYTGIPAKVAYLEAAKSPPRTSPYYRLDLRAEKRFVIDDRRYWAIVLEMLNATLNAEPLEMSCSAYVCRQREVGPIAVPSVGVEAEF